MRSNPVEARQNFVLCRAQPDAERPDLRTRAVADGPRDVELTPTDEQDDNADGGQQGRGAENARKGRADWKRIDKGGCPSDDQGRRNYARRIRPTRSCRPRTQDIALVENDASGRKTLHVQRSEATVAGTFGA